MFKKSEIQPSSQEVQENMKTHIPYRSQDRMGGGRQGTTREAQRAREVGLEGVQDARKSRTVRVDAAAGGAESSAVGDRRGQAWRKSCGIG